MTVKQEQKRKLFRMTTKRSIILSRAETLMKSYVESKESFDTNLIELAPNLSEEERVERRNAVKAEIDRYKEAHDVITVVTSHHMDYMLDTWFLAQRGWKNEWDVPLEVFERGIHSAITLLEHYKSRTNNSKSRYDEPIHLLLELLAFRKA